MDQADVRVKTAQLADDLAWLEEHVAAKPDGAQRRGLQRLAAGMVRNIAAPFLERHGPVPLHVCVVGGAGAGKSTVANLLLGTMLAESNPQAGFTRHPIGFAAADAKLPASLGFLGPLRRLEKSESARLDQDVYQLRRVASNQPENLLLERFVVWDCPDMTTWASSHYATRLLEIAALSDVIVYVASDERYNDEVPTQYLRLFLEAGKSVVVVLVKMREADAPAFLAHFEKEVVAKLPARPFAILAIPQLSAEELADPIHRAARFRIPLVNQVSVLGETPTDARRRSAHAVVAHLKAHQDSLLAAAREDLSALEGWRRGVQEGQIEFENRYRKEYLTAERFRRFDETLVRLLELLELPAIGKILSQGMNLLRLPYTMLKGWFKREPAVSPTRILAEKPVLDAALRGWIDTLRKDAALKRDQHPLWQHLHEGFQQSLGDRCREKFDKLADDFHASLTVEVERTARAILEDLEKSPVALNTLRGSKFALDVAAVVGGVFLGGLTPISVVLVPLAASVSQYLVDLLGENYVAMRREETRSRQLALFNQQLAFPLADWLTSWPTTDGSIYERLQIITRRLPANVALLENAIAGVDGSS